MTEHRIGGQCVLYASAVIKEPNIFCRSSLGEEQNICFNTLSIEYTGRKTENSMKIKILQQLLTNGLSSTTFEQDIIRQDNSSAAAIL